jgi:hypothetical protein
VLASSGQKSKPRVKKVERVHAEGLSEPEPTNRSTENDKNYGVLKCVVF